MERLLGDITLHKPAVAPRVVLTLGNGFDPWAVRAVHKWPVRFQLPPLASHILSPLAFIAEMPSNCAQSQRAQGWDGRYY